MAKLNLSNVKDFKQENQKKRLAAVKLAHYYAFNAKIPADPGLFDKIKEITGDLRRLVNWARRF